MTVPADIFDRATAAGCIALPITWEHARAVEALPFHHSDPFDRLLIPPARVDELILSSVNRISAPMT